MHIRPLQSLAFADSGAPRLQKAEDRRDTKHTLWPFEVLVVNVKCFDTALPKVALAGFVVEQ